MLFFLKVLSDVLGNFFLWVIFTLMGLLDNENQYYFHIFKVVSYVIMMIGVLIYLERMQLNFFGLNLNTRKEIIKRNNDMLLTIRYLPLIDEIKP